MAVAITSVDFTVYGRPIRVGLVKALAAGFTGRNRQAVKTHVDELAELGVAPPPSIPMLYPVMPTLVTTSSEIAVLGPDTTPEVEVAIVRVEGADYLTVASDHTDRLVEASSVARSKNACPKIVGSELWPVRDVLDHWDGLQLASRCQGKTLQEGLLVDLLPLPELLAFVDEIAPLVDGSLLLSGTVPTTDTPPKSSVPIELELRDAERGVSIRHAYTVHVMEELF